MASYEREKFREGVVRCLAVKEARGIAGPALVRELRRPDIAWATRWAVGASLEVVADASLYDDLVTLAEDRSYGRAREMLMPALARTKDPRAVAVLREMLRDDRRRHHHGKHLLDVEQHALVDLTWHKRAMSGSRPGGFNNRILLYGL